MFVFLVNKKLDGGRLNHVHFLKIISKLKNVYYSTRLAPMWQQSGTLLFCSCHGIAEFLVDELQI